MGRRGQGEDCEDGRVQGKGGEDGKEGAGGNEERTKLIPTRL